jgi:hypothetical protein
LISLFEMRKAVLRFKCIFVTLLACAYPKD